MSQNLLDPSSILHTITQIVPKNLESSYDALAAATHAIMLSVGFRFQGLGDDARLGRLYFLSSSHVLALWHPKSKMESLEEWFIFKPLCVCVWMAGCTMHEQ